MEQNRPFRYDAGVIGLGRVGLPLALSLAETGLRVVGFDINPDTLQQLQHKKMPFHEKGYDELLRKVPFEATSDKSRIADAEHLIITVGTPLRHHMEADLGQIEEVIAEITPYLRPYQNVILRSTVAPGTTDFVRKRLEAAADFRTGDNLFLSFCPERIVEGNAKEELAALTQIIGTDDEKSFEKAERLFRRLAPETIRTSYAAAELTKLFNNVSRYVYFAVSNQFAVISDHYGESVYEIMEMANRNYPRKIAALPGLTAGTCLRKDFGMLNEAHPYADLFLTAWKINEFMPKFLVDGMKKRTPVQGKKIAVLGYTFKQDTDDTRDSLVPKLCRYLKREVPAEIRIHDPFLPAEVKDAFNTVAFRNHPLEDALKDAEIVFVAVNHRSFQSLNADMAGKMKEDAWIADLWNVCGTGKIFYQRNP